MAGSGKFRALTIFHYHLLPGGVTDVIILSARAVFRHLPDIEKITIVYGREENIDRVRGRILEAMGEDLSDRLILYHLPEIDYREKVDHLPSAERLLSLMEERFPRQDNLWMVHNYHLGKNPPFTRAMLLAAERRDRPILFQIHDFPECSRYANLAALREETDKTLYPQRENIAYCVINSRDRNNLIEAGMERENIWLLNNPVPLDRTVEADPEQIKDALFQKYRGDFPALVPGGKLLFYPVRTIRRKNILEAALLVRLMEGKANLMVSLPGVSPMEKAYSDLVESAFREGLIPGLWGIGAQEETDLLNYSHFWAASDMIVSPSIQEGFGYLYLNALHWKKPLFARQLDIMEGFIDLFDRDTSHFYHHVYIPLTRDERSTLSRQYERKFRILSEHMPREKEAALNLQMEEMLSRDRFCFSYLSPEMQYEILKKLDSAPLFRSETISMNRENLEELDRLSSATGEDRDSRLEGVFGEKKYAATLQSIMNGLSLGCRKADIDTIQNGMEEKFFSLPYLRLLYGEGK